MKSLERCYSTGCKGQGDDQINTSWNVRKYIYYLFGRKNKT